MFDHKMNKDGTFTVWNPYTGHIYSKSTTNPYKIMYELETQIPKKRFHKTRDLYLEIMDERKAKAAAAAALPKNASRVV
jgi:hypothetical protein